MEDGGRNWIERSELLILLRCVLPCIKSHHMSVASAIWYTSQGAKEEANWLNLCHTHETLQSPCNMTTPPIIFTSTGGFVGSCGESHMMTVVRESHARYIGKGTSYVVLTRLVVVNWAVRRHGTLYYDSRFQAKYVVQNILGWYRAVPYEHTMVYVQTWASGKSENLYFRSLWGITLFTLFLFSTQIHRTINIHICPYNRSSLIFKSRVAAAASGSRIYAALRRTTLHGTRWLIASD